MQASLTHSALRTRIAKVRSAAQDHDRDRFRWEFERLIAAFAEHLAVESPTIATLSDSTRRELRRGREAILSTLAGIAGDLERGDDGRECEALVERLDALLELQDDAERREFCSSTRRLRGSRAG